MLLGSDDLNTKDSRKGDQLHEGNDFNSLAFKRGFVISNALGEAGAFEKVCENSTVTEWTHTYFADWRLLYDPLLKYATVRDNNHGVVVLGLAINPFDKNTTNEAIASKLFEALRISDSKFFDYIDQLTGSFVVLSRTGENVRIIQDAAATKPVFYHFGAGEKTTASSHIQIVADIHKLPVDERAVAILSNEQYKADPSRYLPGLVTPYSGALPLTANSALHLNDRSVRRFFPREPLAPRELDDTLVTEIADLFRCQMQLLTQNRDICIAATGGRDSRLSIAALDGASENSIAFTFHYARSGHLSEDVQIAKKVSEIKGLKFELGDLGSIAKSESFWAAFRRHSPMGIWPDAAKYYLDTFKTDAVHVRSTVSEIGRCFYTKRANKLISPDALATIYSQSDFNKHPMLNTIFSDYIKHTHFDKSLFYNYDWYDMFYWEHRNSKWQNVLCSEAEMASDVFIPYNNREILKKFLSVPFEDRMASKLHFAVIKKLEPSFSSISIV